MGNLRFSNEVGVAGDGSAAHVVATDGTFLAYSLPGGPTVEVVRLGQLSGAPMRLGSELQQRPVISMCFGAGHMGTSDPSPHARRPGSSSSSAPDLPALLFCGSWDAVVAWNLTAVAEAVAHGRPPAPPVQVGVLAAPQVMSDPGAPVYCLTYSAHLSYLVVCAGADVHVFDVRTFRHVYRLDGHSADVLAAAFGPPPSSPHLLVTAGADRTFKLWDLQAGSLVVQSAVLGASPLTCAALEPAFPPRLALGAADGSLRFFDLSSLPAARLLQVVDVGRQVGRALDAAAAVEAAAAAAAAAGPKVISSRPNWKAQMGLQRQASNSGSDTDRNGDDDDPNGDSGNGNANGSNYFVLQLCYVPPKEPPGRAAGRQLPELGYDDDVLEGHGGPPLLPPCPTLLVATPNAVCVVDTRTYEVIAAYLLGRTDPTGGVVSGRPGMGGSLTAPPPPPPGARPRLTLRGIPRAEPSGAVAFAPAPAAACAALGGGGGGGGGGSVVCCSASATEPTVAVLVYDEDAAGPSGALLEGGGGGGGGLPPTPPRGAVARTLSGSSAAASSGMRTPGRAGQRFNSYDGGGGGGGSASGDWDGDGQGPGGCKADDAAAGVLSVFQTRPLPEDSPLRTGPGASGSGGSGGGGSRRSASAGHCRPGGGRSSSGSGAAGGKAVAAAGAGGAAAAGRFASPGRAMRPPLGGGSKKGGLLDKPVTFHSKVKSSGYGFVQGPHQLGRAPPPPVKVSRSAASSSVGRHVVEARAYPLDCGPLTHHQPRNALPGGQPVHPGGAIVRIAFSSDASRLLTASVNRTARVMKLPLWRHGGEGTDLLGHGGPLHGADWSREGTMVLTASADRTARLWDAACAQPLLEFSHLNTQPPRTPAGPASPAPAASRAGSNSSSAAAAAANPLLPHEVRAARFVYMDQFVLLACGNRLLLYRYKLADDVDNDIERLRNRHSYRLAASYTSPAQALLDVSSVNSFLSPLAISAASNRSLELVDLAVMRTVATVPDAHQRPVGCVAQAGTASLFTSHPREAHELFATAAPDNAVKLWDVRAPSRCVRTFAGHKNSQLPICVSFSPCLRHLGCGSEDKVAYLYDIRQGVVAHRVRGAPHADAVTAVAFNPLHPQMAVACLDGRVHFYAAAGGEG